VVDVEFGNDNQSLPAIYTALEVMNGNKKLVLETEQHLVGAWYGQWPWTRLMASRGVKK
jgi:F0F1-type ATP synthase beta subunit